MLEHEIPGETPKIIASTSANRLTTNLLQEVVLECLSCDESPLPKHLQ